MKGIVIVVGSKLQNYAVQSGCRCFVYGQDGQGFAN